MKQITSISLPVGDTNVRFWGRGQFLMGFYITQKKIRLPLIRNMRLNRCDDENEDSGGGLHRILLLWTCTMMENEDLDVVLLRGAVQGRGTAASAVVEQSAASNQRHRQGSRPRRHGRHRQRRFYYFYTSEEHTLFFSTAIAPLSRIRFYHRSARPEPKKGNESLSAMLSLAESNNESQRSASFFSTFWTFLSLICRSPRRLRRRRSCGSS